MKTCRVLVVEDEIIIRKDVVMTLREAGCRIVGETSYAEEAVKLAQSTEVDLVLMDIRLKGKMNGIEAARIITGMKQVPIVIMSAYETDESVRKELPNLVSFLSKPVWAGMLHQVLEIVYAMGYGNEEESSGPEGNPA